MSNHEQEQTTLQAVTHVRKSYIIASNVAHFSYKQVREEDIYMVIEK